MLCAEVKAQVCNTDKKADLQTTFAKQDKTNKLKQHFAKQRVRTFAEAKPKFSTTD